MRGLYIGRFQPFHYGHLMAIKWILTQVDELIIAIGSAQYSHTTRNPFTTGERIEMIWRTLKAEGLLDKCIIAVVPDTDSCHSLWVAMIKLYCPRFDVAFTNDPLSYRLLEEAGIKVRKIPFFKREIYNATRIRELMIRGEEKWRNYVPKEVSDVIDEVHGVERLRFLVTQSDRPQ